MMASGETKYRTGLLTSPGICKDCTRVSLELSIVLVHDESRGVKGCLSIMRDVTERWKKENELKECMIACEAKLGDALT
jgi:signal transduction histidine kinase